MKKNLVMIAAAFMAVFICTGLSAQAETLPTEEIYSLSRFDGLKQEITGPFSSPVPKSFFTEDITAGLENTSAFYTAFTVNMAEEADCVMVYHNLLPEGQTIQIIISVKIPDGKTRNYLILFQKDKDEGYVIPCCRNVYAFSLSDGLGLLKQEMTGTGDEFRVTLISYVPCSVEVYKKNALSEIPAVTAPSYLSENWNTPEYLENYSENSWNEYRGIKYFYNIPYIVSGQGRWSGAGLRNRGPDAANVFITVYDRDGKIISDPVYPVITIPEKGQKSFLVTELPVIGNEAVLEGWMQIKSDQPLSGLSNFAGENNYMITVPLNSDLSEKLHIPHIAQDDQWDTSVTVCNPNNKETAVTLEFTDKTGNSVSSKTYTVPAHGSRECSAADIVQGAGGSIKISAADEITAFALYSNLKSGGKCYSGAGAVK